jgi:hypothetical protein
VLELERSLQLDPEHALDTWLARHNALSQIVVFWYENVHIVVTLQCSRCCGGGARIFSA